MRTVWKYQLQIQDEVAVSLPAGAKVLTFAKQYEAPCIWVLVDTDAPLVERRFRMAGTGHPLTDEVTAKGYVGTAHLFDGKLVLHLFEL